VPHLDANPLLVVHELGLGQSKVQLRAKIHQIGRSFDSDGRRPRLQYGSGQLVECAGFPSTTLAKCENDSGSMEVVTEHVEVSAAGCSWDGRHES
jgi:hypothetical protein